MKRTPALLVFFLLVASSIATGVKSFQTTRQAIEADLTRALQLTALESPDDWLSTDTIHQFRNHLQLADLRRDAFLSLSACEQRDNRSRRLGILSSDSLIVMPSVVARGYVVCSALSVWKHSDQRLSGILAVLGLLALAYSLRKVEQKLTPTLQLTPMQHQFMDLLQNAPGKELSKQELCDALWPGKPDASETLYTLVRRLRPTIEAHTPFRISNIRGRSYRLEEK